MQKSCAQFTLHLTEHASQFLFVFKVLNQPINKTSLSTRRFFPVVFYSLLCICVFTVCSLALVEELLKTPVVRVAGNSWSSWDTWSSCSQSCSKGYRIRRRSCSGPEGKSAPVACRGSPVEYQDCNVQPCPGEWQTLSGKCLFPVQLPHT